jgi:hypothetical protein
MIVTFLSLEQSGLGRLFIYTIVVKVVERDLLYVHSSNEAWSTYDFMQK